MSKRQSKFAVTNQRSSLDMLSVASMSKSRHSLLSPDNNHMVARKLSKIDIDQHPAKRKSTASLKIQLNESDAADLLAPRVTISETLPVEFSKF